MPIVIIALLFIVFLAVEHTGFLVAIVALGGIAYVWHQLREEEQAGKVAQKKREEEKTRAEETKVRNQRVLADRMSSIVACSREAAAALPELIGSAECALDQAEEEFDDGAFAPFWDVIEQAANHVARFDKNVRLIDYQAKEYKSKVSDLASAPPPFELGLDVLPDPSLTAQRMRAIVRRAQKDFHFATIYEQRKTNQLLVEGFNNLGDAINGLTDRLESSLDSFTSSVSAAISGIAAAQAEATSELLSELKATRQHNEQAVKARRNHERKVEERLDNIQRKRKPREW